jgi:hypothetical protein
MTGAIIAFIIAIVLLGAFAVQLPDKWGDR